MLEQKGFNILLNQGKMFVRSGNQVVMEADREHILYYLTAKAVDGESNIVSDESLRLWHMRLGHPAEGSMKELIKKGLIPRDNSNKMDPCEQCILGKAKKALYPTTPLGYIHSDLWGPSSINSIGGRRYYLSIIDDYTKSSGSIF
ncbi:uncharacterized mitochondrial protein AtMg00300-like [Salvia splendens]|uniref:uncharacterized mitochondrial protein AtMg00300-like n=1 Tax=Salvia splendens TaxID=180675 RepID=UPI001C271E29|nr:uncharacterized mitochondrial protein AtMg00300-like [Salvia splendens]